ncbi:histone-lysine N-methyltransferase SETMAR-like [Belonocnema kinseyi]|uniref:histone-lysine N-methyltransferase SETMAR-like n=1 Tax=Belonocnema kinseyi TaxID=2817044 RepID=UPI00143DD381|nr:histone-lysine N-methyltransferase SETMAR-like [Belonocnema kinseyi]
MLSERVCNILHEYFGIQKHCARWVPRLLTVADNAPADSSVVAMTKINELKLELFLHPPYSPDLAPSDYNLFPHLKIWLGGKKFQSNEEVIDPIDEYFEGLNESVNKNGITALEY